MQQDTDTDTESEDEVKFNPPLYVQRYRKVYETITDERWKGEITSLVDFGCAEFKLFRFIKKSDNLNNISLVDIDEDLLRQKEMLVHPLPVEFLRRRELPLKVRVFKGSAGEPDHRLLHNDVVTAVELIEHLYPDEVDAFTYNVFYFIRPKMVIITTPNADFNVVFARDARMFRHPDHKFEWSREQFEDWAHNVTVRFPDYTVTFFGIGKGPEILANIGECSQMALFLRKGLQNEDSLSESNSCECSTNSPCADGSDKSRMLCSCVCSLCVPTFSCGLCTYSSLALGKMSKVEKDGSNIYYKCLTEVVYPHDDDCRTEEQKLLDEIRYRINNIITYNEHIQERDLCKYEIPLSLLASRANQDFLSVEQIEKLLENNGYVIEDCAVPQSGEIETCVIISEEESEPESDMEEVSSNSDVPGFDSDYANYRLNEEDWDDEDPDKLGSPNTKGIPNPSTFPEWLLQILGNQIPVGEILPGNVNQEPHNFCQGDGLGVHPSITVVGVDEDEDTTDSSNNTTDYAEVDPGVSSQDMSSLPEDSQANTSEIQELVEETSDTEPTASQPLDYFSITNSDTSRNSNNT